MTELLNRNLLVDDGQSGQLLLPLTGGVKARVCHTIEGAVIDALAKNAKKFGSIGAHRLVRWGVKVGHQKLWDGYADPRYHRIEGGEQTFGRDYLGLTSKREIEEVGDLLDLFHATEIQIPPTNAYSQILMRTIHPAKGKFRGAIDIVLGLPLLPPYTEEWEAIRPQYNEYQKRLVPIILELPPIIGRPNEAGAQVTLSMRLIEHMTDHATEIATHGGVTVDGALLSRLAQGLHIPSHLLGLLLEAWFSGSDTAPALLKRVDGQRVVLSDAHAPARDFMATGGANREYGRIAGEKSSDKRRQKIRRLAGK